MMSIGRLVLRGNLSWEKISHATDLFKGFTMLFLLEIASLILGVLYA